MDYSKCNLDTLCKHLTERLLEDSLSPREGVYNISTPELSFRNCIECFVSECNYARDTADGYELCEDHDEGAGVTTYYVMREDGETMVTLPVHYLWGGKGCRRVSKERV